MERSGMCFRGISFALSWRNWKKLKITPRFLRLDALWSRLLRSEKHREEIKSSSLPFLSLRFME